MSKPKKALHDFLFLTVFGTHIEFRYTWKNGTQSSGSDFHDGSVKDAARVHSEIVKRYSPKSLETIFA